MIALPAIAGARGWLKIARWALPAAAIAILAGVVWWMSTVIDRTRLERDAAVADVRDFRRTVTDATVPPAANGERPLLSTADAKAALVGPFRDRDDARASLATISRDTRAARARADRADATLAQTQAANLRRLGAAQARIDELERARPAATAAENSDAIETDSKAAWEAWR